MRRHVLCALHIQAEEFKGRVVDEDDCSQKPDCWSCGVSPPDNMNNHDDEVVKMKRAAD